jgi:hypothetical protein
MHNNQSGEPIYKLMTDLDKTFQPAKEPDRENLVILAQQIEISGARLNITPITGRPVGYVPGILETTNQLFTEYDLQKPCKYGYGESGMIQAIPVSAEYQEFIFAHDKKVYEQTKLIREKVYDILENKYNMVLDSDFITDNNRRFSIVIQPTEIIMDKWKKEIKDDVINMLMNDPQIGDFVNCFRNDSEAIQIDHKTLNKSKTLAFDILCDIKSGKLIDSIAFSCDGDNDVEAAKWMIEFAKVIKEAKSKITNNEPLKTAVLPVYQMFDGFNSLIDRETFNNLVNNIKKGFKNVNVFLPLKAHSNLLRLAHDNQETVIHSNKGILTGVLDCMSKKWNFKLNLEYDLLYKKIENVSSNQEKSLIRKEINKFRHDNLETIDKNMNIAYKKSLIAKLNKTKNEPVKIGIEVISR